MIDTKDTVEMLRHAEELLREQTGKLHAAHRCIEASEALRSQYEQDNLRLIWQVGSFRELVSEQQAELEAASDEIYELRMRVAKLEGQEALPLGDF